MGLKAKLISAMNWFGWRSDSPGVIFIGKGDGEAFPELTVRGRRSVSTVARIAEWEGAVFADIHSPIGGGMNACDRAQPDCVDVFEVLADRVRAGESIHVSGQLGAVAGRLHLSTVERLVAETGRAVHVIYR